MIARLRGQVIEKTPPWLVLDVGGVGYQVEVPLSTFEQQPALGETSILLIDMIVREDAMLLYGFASEKEKSLFRLLIKVNGVGPKLALAILSSMSVELFVQSVKEKETNALVKIPGVGKKTAERLVLELATSLDMYPTLAVSASVASVTASPVLMDHPHRQQALQALEALGYKPAEALARVERSWDATISLSEQIKRALQVSL